jgi:hypothetical protein
MDIGPETMRDAETPAAARKSRWTVTYPQGATVVDGKSVDNDRLAQRVMRLLQQLDGWDIALVPQPSPSVGI